MVSLFGPKADPASSKKDGKFKKSNTKTTKKDTQKKMTKATTATKNIKNTTVGGKGGKGNQGVIKVLKVVKVVKPPRPVQMSMPTSLRGAIPSAISRLGPRRAPPWRQPSTPSTPSRHDSS